MKKEVVDSEEKVLDKKLLSNVLQKVDEWIKKSTENEKQRYEQYERFQDKNTTLNSDILEQNRKLVKSTKEQAKHTKRMAEVTLLMVIVTFFGLCASTMFSQGSLDLANKQLQQMSKQAEIAEFQKIIGDKQANISQGMLDLETSRGPHLVLFIEPKSDYCMAVGESATTLTSWVKTFSSYENETITLTAVNGGTGVVNIIGLWSYYKCHNNNDGTITSGFPRIASSESHRSHILFDGTEIQIVFESNILMSYESQKIKLELSPQTIPNRILDEPENYSCELSVSLVYSYDGESSKEKRTKLDFQWVNLTPTELMEQYGCYQKLIS